MEMLFITGLFATSTAPFAPVSISSQSLLIISSPLVTLPKAAYFPSRDAVLFALVSSTMKNWLEALLGRMA